MNHSIYDYVMRRLEADKSNWKAVAAGSGVPYSTLYKIGERIVKDPGVSHIEKLAKWYREKPRHAAA
jgi:predicted transcriptional regulator